MRREKVLVLGGGVGAMVAAHELTATKERRDRFEVTVLQPGHRLGGKGASGRDLERGGRIEEHGLHLWFGFYDTAFRIMRQCYEELGRPKDAPLATLDDAFKGCNGIVLYDREGDGWKGFCARWPEHSGEPGDGHTLPGFWDIAELALGGMLTWFKGLGGGGGDPDQACEPDHPDGWKGWIEEGVQQVGGWLLKGVASVSDNLLEGALALARHVRAGDPPALGGVSAEDTLVTMLDGFRDVTWKTWETRAQDDATVRVFLTCLDTMAATVHGLVKDGVMQEGGTFDALNDEELCEWLGRHGARDVTLGKTPAERAPILRALYDVAFGYREGDIAKADIAAGSAISDLLRLVFTYRGHLAYKMQAGMGDTVFGPFYEVLRERGVKFEFFTAATKLRVDPDEDAIAGVDIVRQVDLDGEYKPLVDVKGLPCWPSKPLWDQLPASAKGVNFEAELNPLDRPVEKLERGKDFDSVVLGISVGGLDGVADELGKRSARFKTAMDSAVTVRTQAFQLWLQSDPEQLGWEHGRDSVAGCYVEPLDTYCDMSHLVEREDCGAEVRGIAYFCGVLDHRKETNHAATKRVYKNMHEFVDKELLGLWSAFDRAHLAWDELEHQYWRANTGGTELYVLSCAGTIDKRLPSGDTGFANLVAAGDWTRNGIDGGCVEAAAISGVQAASALIARGAPAPPPPGADVEVPETVLPPTPIGCVPTWLNPGVPAPVVTP